MRKASWIGTTAGWTVVAAGLIVLMIFSLPFPADAPGTAVGTRITGLVFGAALVAGAVLGLVLRTYRRLVDGRQACQVASSRLGGLLDRRSQVVKALVALVERVGSETEVFGELAALIGGWGTSSPTGGADEATKEFVPAFIVAQHSLPGLAADRAFTELLDRLSNTEDEIAAARAEYNNMVVQQNTQMGLFPGSLIARLFRVKRAEPL